jgi:ring-1,2-phenylacetyl-CoA epoxidase subunit PaaE
MVKNGSVEMLDKDSLSQKEIDKGYVLSCQALPRTQEIFLDFDE